MPRPAHYEDTDVRIDKLTVGPFENNVFILRSKGTGDATLLDAANEHELLLDVSRATGVRRRTIHTPGHTAGSTCFLLEGHPVLFSGDTLFPGGPGNTSLPGGNFGQIIQSIDRRLFSLPGDLLVLPGHGLDTTLDDERPHLQEWIDRGW